MAREKREKEGTKGGAMTALNDMALQLVCGNSVFSFFLEILR